MRSSTVLSIAVLATSAIAAPMAYSAENVQDISAREAFPEAPSYIIARDSTTLERRQPADPATWQSRVGTKTYKGTDALTAQIIKQKTSPFINSATHDYMQQTASAMNTQEKPAGLGDHANAQDAAAHLIANNHPYVDTVVNHYNGVVAENDGTKGQGTLLGNHDYSHIV